MVVSINLLEEEGQHLEEMGLMLKTYMAEPEVVLEELPMLQEQDLTVEMVVFREEVVEVVEPEVLPEDQEEAVDTEESS
jgi:hypothetical protein